MTLQHPDGDPPAPSTTTAQDVGVPAADGEMRELFAPHRLGVDPARPGRELAPQPAHHRRHLPVVALPHAHLLGAGPAHDLQRRLPQMLGAEQAPAGVGPSGARRVARGLGRHRADVRGSRRMVARRPGSRTSCSSSTATATSRRPTSRGPTAPSTTTPGAVVGILNVATETTGQGAGRASGRCVRSTSSPRWPTPRIPRTCAVAPSTCSARTPTTTSERPPVGCARATRCRRPSTTKVATVHVVPVVEPGLARAHGPPAATENPRRPWDADAPGLRRAVRLARRHGPERDPPPRRTSATGPRS